MAFLGPFGTFTEQAVRSQGDLNQAELVAYRSVPDVLDAVQSGEVDFSIASRQFGRSVTQSQQNATLAGPKRGLYPQAKWSSKHYEGTINTLSTTGKLFLKNPQKSGKSGFQSGNLAGNYKVTGHR